MKILHVDDLENWRGIIPRVLSEHEVVSFSTLKDAKAAGLDFDAFIVDGSIDRQFDGIAWAKELQKAGKKVAILSAGNPVDGVPFFDKAPFDDQALRLFLS